MTSSTPATARTARTPRAARRLLLVAGATAAALPALAAAASADEPVEPAEPATVCRTVAGDDLGRDDATTRVELGSGLALVRERDRLHLEGATTPVTLTVDDGEGWSHAASLADGVLQAEMNRDGYVGVEVCWQQAVVVPDRPDVVPAQVGATEQGPTVVYREPEPEQPERVAVATGQQVADRPTVVPGQEPADTAAAEVRAPSTSATLPTAARSARPAAGARAAELPATASAPRLAVTGAPVGPLAALSGGAVALGAALVVLRARLHRAHRNG